MAKDFKPTIRTAFNRMFTILNNNPDILRDGKEAAREYIKADPQFARQWEFLNNKYNDPEFVEKRFLQLSDSAMSQVAQEYSMDYVPDEDELGPACHGGMEW